MAKINGLIPAQNFERIRDRIGEILAEEIPNQYALESPPSGTAPTVYKERIIPFAPTEHPAINVCLSRGDYDNKNMRSVDGGYVFNIDVYAASKSTDDARGDTLAALALQKLLGMCRAILENPVYKTLGFAPPFNTTLGVISIFIPDPLSNEEATSSVQGRLEFYVKVPENVELQTAVQLQSSVTTVRLYETDKGYFWGPSDKLVIIDSPLLPATDIQVRGLKIDGTEYPINETFDDRDALLDYLNTDFNLSPPLAGSFVKSNNLLGYINEDGFSTIEIMAIYQTKVLVFKMGTPPDYTLNNVYGIPVVVGDGNTLQHDDFIGAVLMGVELSGSEMPPTGAAVGVSGWNNTTGTITLGQNYTDTYFKVLFKQTAA